MDRARRLGLLAVLAAALLAVPAPLEAAGRCGDAGTTPDEGHLHLLGDAAPPVGYRSTPPASGWHYRQRDRIRLGVAPQGEPLSEPEQVSVLAVGGVVIGYRDLPAADVEALRSVVAAAGERPVALTSYGALEPGEVALSAWRLVQRCDGLDLGAVEAFVETHAAAEPDFGMSGEQAAHDHGGAAAAPDPGATGMWPPLALALLGLGLLGAFAVAVRRALHGAGVAAAGDGEQAG